MEREDLGDHPGITSVGIVTCNRLQALETCLRSYAANRRKHGGEYRFVVADDSKDPSVRKACREMLGAFAGREAVPIFYVGLEKKESFAERLIRSGCPEAAVRIGLIGQYHGMKSPGANRNSLLLECAGELVFMADDDTVCQMAQLPSVGGELVFAAGTPGSGDPATPGQIWRFPNREAALAAVNLSEADPVEAHGRYLGRPLAAIAREHAAQAGACPPGMRDGMNERSYHIVATINGLIGDCGWNSPSPFFWLSGTSLDRFIGTQQEYAALSASRELVRSVESVTVMECMSNMMATFFGLDNRHGSVPFMPAGRGQDVIFGITLSMCCDAGLFAALPWLLLHQPVESRFFVEGQSAMGVSAVDMCLVALACLNAAGPLAGADGRENRLGRLGAFLQEIGHLPPHALDEFMREHVGRQLQSMAAELSDRLQQRNREPAYWAKDVQRLLEILQRTLKSPRFYLPFELRWGCDAAESLRRTAQYIRHFGELLTCWPAMVECAKELAGQGERLAECCTPGGSAQSV